MFQIWLAAVVFGMPVALQITSSQVEANSYERRFTISTVENNFNDSLSWCRMDNNNNNNNSSLAVVNDSDTQMALALFLNSSSHSSTAPMFINLRLSQQVPSTWYLVNRTQYGGYIENQDTHKYFLNGHLKFQGDNHNFFGVDGSSPADFRNYICDFEENRCPTGNIVYNGRCYVKYENENLTWYKARERCIDNGGDLAQFQNYNNAWFPPFNTTWLDKSLTYWIGIRYNGWSWNSSGSDYESIFTSWSINKPNNSNYECVCVDPNGSPLWSWTDCDCNVQRQFVCLKEVTIQTTTPMTTTAITTTMNPSTPADLVTTIGFSVTTSNNNNNTTTTTKDVDHTNLIIGVVVGVGGGLILLIVVIVVLVIICKRRQRRSKSGSDTGSDGNENGGYNENVQNGVYAAVIPGKNQGKQTESKSETIYTSPLFTKETNSPPPDPNYEAVDHVEEPDVVRSLNTSRGRQTKSIFPQGDTDVYANAKEVPNATD